MNKTILTKSPQKTREIGRDIAKLCKKGAIICLFGDLGTGKTEFTKGFASQLGIPEKSIKSPTFTFLREYKTKKGKFYHFDFYRIEETDHLLKNSLEEIFAQKNSWIVIEWAQHIQVILPRKRINIFFEYMGQSTRKISIKDEKTGNSKPLQ